MTHAVMNATQPRLQVFLQGQNMPPSAPGGHGHARALRSIADRLIAVACAMLENSDRLRSKPAPAEPARHNHYGGHQTRRNRFTTGGESTALSPSRRHRPRHPGKRRWKLGKRPRKTKRSSRCETSIPASSASRTSRRHTIHIVGVGDDRIGTDCPFPLLRCAEGHGPAPSTGCQRNSNCLYLLRGSARMFPMER